MTDLELKELVANLAVRQTTSEQRLDRTEQYLEQVSRDLAESAQRHKATDEQLEEWELRTKQYLEQASRDLAESAQRHKELDLQQRETARQMEKWSQEAERRSQEAEKRTQETDRQLKELGRQIGGLGQKFGGFTEGMAFPSMKRILEERFQMTNISAYQRSRRNGRTMEIDALAYANTNVNEVYIVEVKSTLREEGLDQILRILREFHDFFPTHQGKKLYGILAAVNVPDEVRNRVLRAGIYLARIHDESFEISVPDDFQPRAF